MNNAQLFSSAALPGPLPYSAAKSGAAYAPFGLPVLAAGAAVAPVVNQVVYTPFFVPFAISVSRLGAMLASSPTGQNLRFAIYAVGSDGLPGSLICDFGTNVTATSYSAVAGTAQALQRGWYYFAMNANATSYSPYGFAPSNVPAAMISGLLPILFSAIGTPVVLNAASQTFGAFPGTATAPTTNFANFPVPVLLAA